MRAGALRCALLLLLLAAWALPTEAWRWGRHSGAAGRSPPPPPAHAAGGADADADTPSQAWPAGVVHFRDLPAYAASASVRTERAVYAAACERPPRNASAGHAAGGSGCAMQPVLEAMAVRYATLDRVFVFDWWSIGTNGLGNSLKHFQRVLFSGLLADRAAFSLRNMAHCSGESCRMDPGAYFGVRGGVEWRWSEAVGEALAARGVRESVFVYDDVVVGYRNKATGERVSGALTVLALLQHPAVRQLPWVRLVSVAQTYVPGSPRMAAVDALWRGGCAALVAAAGQPAPQCGGWCGMAAAVCFPESVLTHTPRMPQVGWQRQREPAGRRAGRCADRSNEQDNDGLGQCDGCRAAVQHRGRTHLLGSGAA
jgi:hypothetical protein